MDDPVVDIGRYGDGSRMILPIPGWGGAHWLACGSTGSGKTTMLKVLCAELMVRYPWVALAICDPHMVGYKRLLPRLSCLAYGWETADDFLALIRKEMVRRIRLMDRLDIEEWEIAHLGVLGPYLVVLVDELAAVTALSKDAPKLLTSLAQELRKAGGGLVLCANSPKNDAVLNTVREQCPIRWCGRCRSREQVYAALGSYDHPAHQPDHPDGIPIPMKGGCYVDDGFHTRRGRTKHIDRDTVAEVARKYKGDAHDFGWDREIRPFDLDDTTVTPIKSKRAATAGRNTA